MKPGETEFEVIDQYGERHRFSRPQYWWAWKPKPGTIDVDDPDFLHVFQHFEEGEDDHGEGDELFAVFPRPAKVGGVTPDTCLTMPFRELSLERCPMCGYVPGETSQAQTSIGFILP